MYNFIVVSSRKSITHPWPEDVYTTIEDHTANCVEDYNTVTGTVNQIQISVSEDGLSKILTWEFASEADFNTWKSMIEARDTYSDMISTVDFFVDETDDRYKHVDNVWYFESDYPNW